MGLTDACRLIVRGAGLPVTPTEIRDRLHAFGFDLSKYSNELAAIHTILKRLNEAGELRFVAKGAAKPAYIWNRPPHAVSLGPDIAEFIGGLPPERAFDVIENAARTLTTRGKRTKK
jgi:hypothetical protein